MSKLKYLWINSKIQSVLEKCAPLLAEVLDQFKKIWTFVKGILGSLKRFNFDPSWISFAAGVYQSPFQVSKNLNMMQQTSASLVQGKARDVTTHPH